MKKDKYDQSLSYIHFFIQIIAIPHFRLTIIDIYRANATWCFLKAIYWSYFVKDFVEAQHFWD